MTHWLHDPVSSLDEEFFAAALGRQARLTKPPGSLGRLERLGATLAAMQRTQRPDLSKVSITVFAADHGVAAEGVSAYPQVVTAEMVRNFARGGAAISVLADELGCALEVVNVGTVCELESLPGVIERRLGPGTANFTVAPAMTRAQLEGALALGKEAVERALGTDLQLFVGAEMGIGNTSSAAAIGCAMLGSEPRELCGPGTGLDERGVAHKAEVIGRALQRCDPGKPLDALRELGGFEIAALCGAYVRCAQLAVPALVDGFIATAAALVVSRECTGVMPWLIFGHRSAEPGHGLLLEALGAEPILALSMRLGEGSGAALAVPILRAAAALHGRMATFDEAGVSG